MADTPHFVFIESSDVALEQAVLKDICKVDGLGVHTLAEIPESIASAHYIAVWHNLKIKEETLRKFTNCKAIIRMGVGYDNVDVEAAGRLGIPVCNIPAYGTEEVADTNMSLILSLFRQTAPVATRVREGLIIKGSDDTREVAPFARRLRGATLGLYGLGAIGTAVALRAAAFGMKLIFYDPYVSDGTAKALNAHRVYTLTELAQQSDCVTINCLLSPETRHSIGSDFLSAMKQGSFVVNTGRGGIVDEQALYAHMKSGHIGGCGLDVVESEPLSNTNVLSELPNAILTPHIGWFSQEAFVEMRETAAETVKRAIEGKGLRNVVNARFLAHKN